MAMSARMPAARFLESTALPRTGPKSGRYVTSHHLEDLAGSNPGRRPKQIVKIFDQTDLPRSQARPGQPNERVEFRPGDRLDRETRPPARIEPAERVPDMLELERKRRGLELGLERGALLRPVRPLEQPLEDLPIWNAVLERRELECFLGKRPQLVAEG
jgi:hypothetical protein